MPQAFTHRRTRYMRARSDEPGTLVRTRRPKARGRETRAAVHGTQSTFSAVLKRMAQSIIPKYLLDEQLKRAITGMGVTVCVRQYRRTEGKQRNILYNDR